ncbi:uncharacterized protein [Phaseolus vulgaris]|uniref:uncharacterized protein n=1 Tax=Phaseolus vulgaris TaxID=3885 RepID=UPI0035CB62E0
MWSNKSFQLSRFVNGRNYTVLEGFWKRGNGAHVTIVNIYCSGSLREKKELWNEVGSFRQGQLSKAWCIIGDFNSIRRQEERKNVISNSDYSREIKGFNDFIERSKLVDIPLVGRKFTWFKPNNLVKSRIDRVLVSKEWLDFWPNSQQFILSRSISDHCAVILKEVSVDWGLKPFRCLDVWQKDSKFKEFVRSSWTSYKVVGRGIFVLKEKLKKLKADLKVWNKEVFGDMNQTSKEIQQRLDELDFHDDEVGLYELEREERKSLFAKLSEEVKNKVREFFEERFARNDACQVRLDKVEFNSISEAGNVMLIGDFSEEEIISKALSLRLKKVIGKIIDARQSTFLEGRGLLDSVLVANEVLEEYKRKRKSCVFFKVDYEKAYDLVNWDFIFYMLRRLRFCDRWIRWIKGCLESASVSVLVNGSPTTEFFPRKGLRQGDSLAPFLFLIVAEGLAGVARVAEEKKLIDSLEVGKDKVKVNMLQYADDTLFFCEANTKSVFNIKAILQCFELSSG